MRAKRINSKPQTYALILQTGDEVTAILKQFAQEQRLAASRFSAIGAFSDLVLGYFNLATQDYDRISLTEQVEVLSLLGNVTLENGDRRIHAHVVVGKADGTAHGGHLLQAHVRPTLEIIIEESPEHLKRRFNRQFGLALIDPDA